MKIISIHNGHDASITAMENGEIIYHWELERHFVKKHFVGIQRNITAEFLKCHVLPLLSWQVDLIDFVSLGSMYIEWVQGRGPYEHSEFNNLIQKYGQSLEKPYEMWQKKWCQKNQNFFCSSHHLNHMAYAFYTSPFQEALVFAYDGCGDFKTSTTYGVGKNNRLEYLGNLKTHPEKDLPNNQLGIAFNRMGEILNFFGTHPLQVPGKVMGYSSYGKIRSEWFEAIEDCIVQDNLKKITLLERFNLPQNMDSEDERAMDLIATFQHVCEEYVIKILKKLIKKTGQKNICLSGGCALNVLINERIRNEITENVYIPPACNDSGQSIGSALYLWHHVLNNNFFPKIWHNPYLGDLFQNNCIEDKEINRLKINNEEELIEKASRLLLEKKIIAWVQGRGEIGPRALGNRSIFCLPSDPNMKDLINQKVKHREWWRPFAPVCLYEDAQEWFDINIESPYMLFSPMVRPEKKHLIPAVTHIDGSARLQTVKEYQNPLLYKLLKKIKEKTGVPILLNTSLNDKGKPIANHIQSIYELLKNTQLDCAFVNLELITLKKIFL